MFGKKNQEILVDDGLVGGIIAFDKLAKINKTNKTLKKAFLVSMGLNIAAITSMMLLLPLKQDNVFVYSANGYTGAYDIVEYANAKRSIKNIDSFVERDTQRFISLLFGYNKNTLNERKDQLMQYCDVSFQPKAMKIFNHNIEQFVDKVRAEALISSSVRKIKLKNSPLTRLTFFITIKISPESMENYETTLKKQVTLYYDYASGNASKENLLINPSAFKVYDIEVTDLENEQNTNDILKKIKEAETKNREVKN